MLFFAVSCDDSLKFKPYEGNSETSQNDSDDIETSDADMSDNDSGNTDSGSDSGDTEPNENNSDADSGDSVPNDDADSTDTTSDNSDSASDNDTDTDSGDLTPDEDADNQESGFDPDSQGIWVDPKPFNGSIHLMWENPMGNKGMGSVGPSHANALTYCENLVLAGHDDWRLPTIDELRTLVRGVSTTMTGGTCPTSESCSDQDTCNKNKNNSQPYGYSCFGCYALDDQYKDGESFLTDDDCQLSDIQLENNECYIVPAMFGDPCNGTWSNTPNTSSAGKLANAFWYLNYKAGYIGSDSDTLSGANWVRCVREGTAADVTE